MDKKNEMIIYQSSSGVKLDLKLDGETFWLSQGQMADLFGVKKAAISKHIKNIFSTNELNEIAVVSKMETTAADGKMYLVNNYNLDMVIAVGYRVNSVEATAFRIWATKVLKEYIVKGFAMDDERLKNLGGGDYWHELLDRIRDIRSSEKVMYRQVLDLYATSIDYDAKAEETLKFFKTVQNKLHYAVHGHTAPEIIYDRADAEKPFMGLTFFSGSQPTLKDVTVAKNYLDESELKLLANIVSGYFDFAETQAMRHIPMHMKDYESQLDSMLTTGKFSLLQGNGTISRADADAKAIAEYRKYQVNSVSSVEQAYVDSIRELRNKKLK